MTDEVLTNLAVGLTMVFFGGFLAILPHRFLHPFNGKAAHLSKAGSMFLRIGGFVVCSGGIRFVLISLWAIWKAGH